MRALFTTLLLATSLTAVAPALAQSAAIDPEFLVAHPGLAIGEFDQVRDDWVQALEDNPDTRSAFLLMQRVAEIDGWCSAPLRTSRIANLQRHVLDPEARAVLAAMHIEGQRRDRAAGRSVDGHDVFHEWLTEWRVAGPWGRPDAPEPLSTLAPLASQDWRPLRRPSNRNWIAPDQVVFPSVGGVYTAIMVRSDEPRAELLLDADERCIAYWNDFRILTALREDPYGEPRVGQTYVSAGGESTFRIPVEFREGWNLLLIATPAGSDLYLGARFVRRDGSPVTVEEMPADQEYAMTGYSELSQAGPSGSANRSNLGTFQNASSDPLRQLYRDFQQIVDHRLDGHAHRSLRAFAESDDYAAVLDQAPWLVLTEHHLALQAAFHLPSEVARGRMLAVEEQLIERGMLGPRVGYTRAERMLDEDRPEEALELLAELQQRYPNCWRLGSLEVDALEALDRDGMLAMLRLTELQRKFPQRAEFATMMRELCSDAGAVAEAEAWARVARGLGEYGSSNWHVLMERATRRDDGELDRLMGLAEDWLRAEPRNGTAEWMALWIARVRGNEERVLASHEEDKSRYGKAPDAALSLAEIQLKLGKDLDQVEASLREALRRQPGEHDARALLRAMGRPADEAETFFRDFAPDVDAALTRRGTATGASTALLLDHGMVYLLPDGAYQYRTHTLAEALDRAGTEELHEQAAAEFPIVTRVHDLSGQVFEPHQVEGSWVMPSLDPGDVVEQIYDRFEYGVRGITPVPGSWRFASFSEPFLISRWVLYVPDEVDGEFRESNFDGVKTETRWQNGTVYTFEVRDSARIEPEALMPSELEVLPWVEFGADRVMTDHLQSWYRWLRWQNTVPADIDLELRAFVAEQVDASATPIEKAEELHRAMSEHVLEFSGGGDVTDVWTQRRGDPTGLYAALLDRAEVSYEWALSTGVAPELDPNPVRGFESGEEYGLPLMRIASDDGRVVWVRPDVRGAAFGQLPATMAGAELAVLSGPPLDLRWRREELPRGGDQDTWNLDFQVKYLIDGEDAIATGTIRITGSEGMALREQLSQAPPQQLDAVAGQVCASLIEGMDLEKSEFPGLQEAGAPLTVAFEGRIPGFVRVSNSGVAGARLRIPELSLSTGLGAADRKMQFAFRNLVRLRARIELDCAGDWLVDYGPEPRSEQLEGFRYDFQVEENGDNLQVERVLEMRGLMLAAEEFPGFLELLAELEKEESRAVKLTPVVIE